MIRVYIASAYTIGDKEENVRKSLETANELINNGLCPFAPLLTHYQDLLYPQSWEKWLQLDLEWLHLCDYVLRLPGESKGADIEVEEAIMIGKPVFYSIESLLTYLEYNGREESTI